jgi:hypothetical protein
MVRRLLLVGRCDSTALIATEVDGGLAGWTVEKKKKARKLEL